MNKFSVEIAWIIFITIFGSCEVINLPVELPEVETKSVINITSETAESGGNVTDDGGSPILERGVCWSTSPNPSISDSNTVDGTVKGEFNSIISGLLCDTTYYVRAYATNSAGTGYGEEASFKTEKCLGLPEVEIEEIEDITQESAETGGEIVSDGGSAIMEKGVVWSTSPNPTIADSRTSDGTGNDEYESLITDLSCGTTYYVRAYATNSIGTSYGKELSFTTLDCSSVSLPEVETEEIEDITQESAETGGEIISDGGSAITEKGVVWSTSPNPKITDSRTSDGSGNDEYESSITDLSCGTTYYVRAYATNSTGTGYGEEFTFTTLECDSAGLPEVETEEIEDITRESAKSGGEIISDGGSPILERGVCWSSSPDPTVFDRKTTDGSGDGEYESLLTNLSCNTTYYVRAYATNSQGTSYGKEISFTTLECEGTGLPVVETEEIENITQESAESGGEIESDGGSPILERGVCWSTSPNPTIADSRTSDGSGGEEYESLITGLNCGTTYYVRAYATNSAGTGYGEEISFTTLECEGTGLPVVETEEIEDITQESAESGGEIESAGGSPVTERGVCWSTSPNPTIADNRTLDGSGDGEYESLITGLSCGTTYYVRAYATNSQGTGYGEELTFTTLECEGTGLPVVETEEIEDITQESAESGGEIESDGGSPITERGVCWSTSPNPTIADNHTLDGSGDGEYESKITGLSCGTTYYVRAYATNSTGTGYGEELSFTTAECSAPLIDEIVKVEIFDGAGNIGKGNGDGKINVGEEIEMKISIQNNGNGKAEDIEASLILASTHNPYCTINDSESDISELIHGSIGIFSDNFEFEVKKLSPDNKLDFGLNLNYEDEYGKTFLKSFETGTISVEVFDLAEPAISNLNTSVVKSDTARSYKIYIQDCENTGEGIAYNVSAELKINNDHTIIDISDNEISFPDIPNKQKKNGNGYFEFHTSGSPSDGNFDFIIVVSFEDILGNEYKKEFSIEVAE